MMCVYVLYLLDLFMCGVRLLCFLYDVYVCVVFSLSVVSYVYSSCFCVVCVYVAYVCYPYM
jgi:hypothetical protein